jgi:signal transduction histidine kinase
MLTGMFSRLFSFSPQKGSSSASAHSEDNTIIQFLMDQIEDKKSVQSIVENYGQIKVSDKAVQNYVMASTYGELENFIVSHAPPVVKKTWTRDEIRKQILDIVPVRNMSQPMQVIFLPSSMQIRLLFELGLTDIIDYTYTNLGNTLLEVIIKKTIEDTPFVSIPIAITPAHPHFDFEVLHRVEVSNEQLSSFFLKLNQTIYYQIENSFGKNVAFDLYNKNYHLIKDNYSYDLVCRFLETMPQGLFEKDKAIYKSRETLEIVVNQKAGDLDKIRFEMERKVEDLNSTKSAVLNLLEDAKILENNLKQERDRAQIIINSVTEGLIVMDPKLRITLINDAAEKMFQMASGTAVGKDFIKITTLYKGKLPVETSQRPAIKTLTTGIGINTTLDDDFYFQVPNGKIPVAISTAILKDDTTNSTLGVLLTFRDVSTEKEEKEIIEKTVEQRTKELREKNVALELAKSQISEGWLQLQQEKARLTASINSLTVGFIMTDMNENIITVNQSALRIFNTDQDSLTMAHLENWFKGQSDIHAMHIKASQSNTPFDLPQLTYQNKYLHITIAPVTLSQLSEVTHIGIVFLITDITERRILDRSKDEFFSIASHELRTLLTAIRGNTSLIKQFYLDKLPDQDIKDMISDIHESSIRLIEIVNDFLDTSRLEQGKFEFKLAAFAVEEFVEECLKEFNTTGSEKKLFLKYEPAAQKLPLVYADRNRSKQVLINLIGNAIKFTETGGITVKTTLEHNFIQTSVTDTGRGIPIQTQSLLFRKFQQAGESLFTRDATRGTGLGLYISKLMITGMNGSIALMETQENSGSTFAFTLPIATQEQIVQKAPVVFTTKTEMKPASPSQPAANKSITTDQLTSLNMGNIQPPTGNTQTALMQSSNTIVKIEEKKQGDPLNASVS